MHASIIVVGRLIGDPELRSVESNGNTPTLKATGCLSVNRPYKRAGAQYPESDLFNFEVWGKEAESLVNQCRKDKHILIQGTPEFYEAQDGSKRFTIRKSTWRHIGPAKPTGLSTSPAELDDIGF